MNCHDLLAIDFAVVMKLLWQSVNSLCPLIDFHTMQRCATTAHSNTAESHCAVTGKQSPNYSLITQTELHDANLYIKI